MKFNTFLLFACTLILSTMGMYTKFYRKCQLGSKGNQISSLNFDRVPRYDAGFQFPQGSNSTREIQYTEFNFVYISYIASGGSGQVFLVEDQKDKKFKVVKRFFQESPISYAQENYIMHKMQYYIGWHHQDNIAGKPTLASYTSEKSMMLRDLDISTAKQAALILYKICVELQKAHSNGVIHNDLKRGNILVKSVGDNLRQTEIQLIDWNLASFYYPGYQSDLKKGTPCYYSPQVLLRSFYITPAADIWSLALVFYTLLANHKPFPYDCNKHNLQAVVRFVGSRNFVNFFNKYHQQFGDSFSQVDKILSNPDKYPPISLTQRIAPGSQHLFDANLIDLLDNMLQVDPEKRITITEILQHPYFDIIKRLPQMHQEENKQQQSSVQQLHAPANNLRKAVSPKINQKLI